MANAAMHTGDAGILTVGDMAQPGPSAEVPSDLGDGVNTPWRRTEDQPYAQGCARKLATNMNTLVENIPAKTAQAFLPGTIVANGETSGLTKHFLRHLVAANPNQR